MILAYEILLLLILSVAATYTWLTLTYAPSVNSLNMYVNTSPGLMISSDLSSWGYQLDFGDLVTAETPLRPVTWSQENMSFYAVAYSYDGRITGWEQLSDEENANDTSDDCYYMKLTYYMTAGQQAAVCLSPAVTVDEEGTQGSGTYVISMPEWDAENLCHVDTGKGGECAVRIGFLVTYVDAEGTPTGEDSEFFIYEPNYNRHVAGGLGYSPTASIDGTDTLVDMSHMILQGASTWSEADPVEHGVVELNLGSFLTNPTLFTLEAGQIVQIDMYIWLEGQDKDCVNQMNGADIFASIQFAGSSDPTGMQPIPQE